MAYLQDFFKQIYGNVSPEWGLNRMNDLIPGGAAKYNNIQNILANKKIPLGQQNAATAALKNLSTKSAGIEDVFAANPLKTKIDINGVTANPLKYNLGAVGQAIKAHPFKAAGLGVLGAANISGLMDDDKVGGQLVGGLGGAALPMLMTKLGMAAPTPIGKLAMVMGGGALGSLFDKLRAKKEVEEQAAAQPYAQY
jgi:hypothetical protein